MKSMMVCLLKNLNNVESCTPLNKQTLNLNYEINILPILFKIEMIFVWEGIRDVWILDGPIFCKESLNVCVRPRRIIKL